MTDINLQFDITNHCQKLKTSLDEHQADVEFSGNSSSFLQLATQEVDPDTLFFQRKLKISGDTELGLEVKNFLATLEPKDKLPPALYTALKKVTGFIQETSVS